MNRNSKRLFHPNAYNPLHARASASRLASPPGTEFAWKNDNAQKHPPNLSRDLQRLSDIDEIHVGEVIGVGDGPGRGAKTRGD